MLWQGSARIIRANQKDVQINTSDLHSRLVSTITRFLGDNGFLEYNLPRVIVTSEGGLRLAVKELSRFRKTIPQSVQKEVKDEHSYSSDSIGV